QGRVESSCLFSFPGGHTSIKGNERAIIKAHPTTPRLPRPYRIWRGFPGLLQVCHGKIDQHLFAGTDDEAVSRSYHANTGYVLYSEGAHMRFKGSALFGGDFNQEARG